MPEIKSLADIKALETAHSCKFCIDTGDSKGQYVSTYCYKNHKHLSGFSTCGPIPCPTCPDRTPRNG